MKRRKEEKKERKRWAETRRTAQSAEPFDPSQAGLRADLPSRPASRPTKPAFEPCAQADLPAEAESNRPVLALSPLTLSLFLFFFD